MVKLSFSSFTAAHKVAALVYLAIFLAIPFLLTVVSWTFFFLCESLLFLKPPQFPLYSIDTIVDIFFNLMYVVLYGFLLIIVTAAIQYLRNYIKFQWYIPLVLVLSFGILISIMLQIKIKTTVFLLLGFFSYWSTFSGNEAIRKRPGIFKSLAIILGIVLIIVGAMSTQQRLVSPVSKVWRARDWKESAVFDLTTGLSRFHGNWYLLLKYSYYYGNRKYVSNRYGFLDPVDYLKEHELMSLQDSKNLPSSCLVDPANPENAVLVPELPPRAYIPGMLGVLLFAAGIWMVYLRHKSGAA